jgi:hypothetical protein
MLMLILPGRGPTWAGCIWRFLDIPLIRNEIFVLLAEPTIHVVDYGSTGSDPTVVLYHTRIWIADFDSICVICFVRGRRAVELALRRRSRGRISRERNAGATPTQSLVDLARALKPVGREAEADARGTSKQGVDLHMGTRVPISNGKPTGSRPALRCSTQLTEARVSTAPEFDDRPSRRRRSRSRSRNQLHTTEADRRPRYRDRPTEGITKPRTDISCVRTGNLQRLSLQRRSAISRGYVVPKRNTKMSTPCVYCIKEITKRETISPNAICDLIETIFPCKNNMTSIHSQTSCCKSYRRMSVRARTMNLVCRIHENARFEPI